MNEGALLYLPINAKSEDTVANTIFGKWMIRNIDCWFAWARKRELGVERMEDIVLVTGTHRTRSCGNVAFPGVQDAQVSFRARVDHRSDVVTINCPLHEKTRGLFNKELIAKMKPGMAPSDPSHLQILTDNSQDRGS